MNFAGNNPNKSSKAFEYSITGISTSSAEKPFVYDGANSSEGNIVYHTADNMFNLVITEVTYSYVVAQLKSTQTGVFEFAVKVKDQYWANTAGYDQKIKARIVYTN